MKLLLALVAALTMSGTLWSAGMAAADPCPADKFSLWTGKQLRGADIFQGRNPGGGPSGIGDGEFSQADFDDLRRAGANYVQLSHAGVFEEAPPYALDSVAEAALDLSVQRAMAAGLYVVIAFRSGPGRNENAISNRDGLLVEKIWTAAAARAAWVAMLKHTAEHFRGNPAVIGYSVMVEPNSYARHGFPGPAEFYAQFAGTLEDVNGLYSGATAAIRQVDADIPILLEPEGYGNIAWLPFLTVTGDQHTVYTPHDYTPFAYTHEEAGGEAYPGTYDLNSDGRLEVVDKDFLAALLNQALQFHQTNSVPVAITEFGVHRTSSNAAAYLHDRIEIQNAIGGWAVWTWQPAGFDDPFNVHDASSVHDALVEAWSANCTPVFDRPPEPSGMLKGRTLTPALRPLKAVRVRVGSRTIAAGTDGRYATTLPAGSYTLRPFKSGYLCAVGSIRGPQQRVAKITADHVNTITIYCRRR